MSAGADPSQPRSRRGVSRPWLAYVTLIGGALIWSRIAPVTQSFWYDEVYTARYYVGGDLTGIFRDYLPNNHVLFSILTWFTTGWLGEGEAVHRLWSVVPAIVGVAILTRTLWLFVGPLSGVMFLVLATTSPVHLELSTQARGYGLGFLATALMIDAAFRNGRERDDPIVGFSLSGAVGIAALPVIATAFVAQLAVFLASLPRRRVVGAGALVALACGALYLPMMTDLLVASRQEFGEALAWHAPLTGWFTFLVRPTAELMPGPTVVGAIASLVALLLGAWRLGVERREFRVVSAHLIAPVLGTFMVLTVLRFHVVDRFVSFLLFYVLALIAVGIGALPSLVRHAVPDRWHRGLVRSSAVTVISLGVAVALLPGFWGRSTEMNATPHEAYREVALVAGSVEVDVVHVNSRLRAGFDHYLLPTGAAIAYVEEPAEVERLGCETDRPVLYIDYPLARAVDVESGPCLRREAGVDITFPQRAGGPQGWMRIWIVP